MTFVEERFKKWYTEKYSELKELCTKDIQDIFYYDRGHRISFTEIQLWRKQAESDIPGSLYHKLPKVGIKDFFELTSQVLQLPGKYPETLTVQIPIGKMLASMDSGGSMEVPNMKDIVCELSEDNGTIAVTNTVKMGRITEVMKAVDCVISVSWVSKS